LEPWQWLALAGLGVFHGLNPAMGWLFSVALALHRRSRRVLFVSLLPIAAGHAAAVAATLVIFGLFGVLLNARLLAALAGAVLLGWAAWHAVRGHRQPVRVGMRTGLAGLALWSFLMAGAHGAGLMLIPVAAPLHHAHGMGGELGRYVMIGAASLAIHTAAMLATIGVIAVLVYDYIGLAVLRRGWINFDRLWTAALAASGAVLLFTAWKPL
jgi:hypothetical protein